MISRLKAWIKRKWRWYVHKKATIIFMSGDGEQIDITDDVKNISYTEVFTTDD